MNSQKTSKLKQFANDVIMAESIYDLLLEHFMKPREGDVYIQAASKISIDNLNNAWKEVKGYAKEEEKEVTNESNIGV